MIRLRGVRKAYQVGKNRLEVLKGVDTHVSAGELVSIMGSSGSGKSTLLHVMGLLDDYDEGEYHLDGQLVKGLSETRAAVLRNQTVGFVFQAFNLIPFKTALENVALPLYYRGVSRSKRNRRAAELLERLGLADWSEHLPTEMSGGQQQRVAIARALVTDPKVVFADEPTGALDSETSLEVMKTLVDVNDEGVTVVIVTHEHDIAGMADRTIHLKDGLIDDGAPPLQAAEAGDHA